MREGEREGGREGGREEGREGPHLGCLVRAAASKKLRQTSLFKGMDEGGLKPGRSQTRGQVREGERTEG